MKQVWVAVLSQKELKLFSRDIQTGHLSYLSTIVNNVVNLPNREISRHKPGVINDGGKGVSRHIMNSGVNPHDLTTDLFARQIVDFLDEERKLGHVGELIMIAEPRFQGRVRSTMPAPLQKIVREWISKDLDHATTGIIESTITKFSEESLAT